jgi:hypothetical protein
MQLLKVPLLFLIVILGRGSVCSGGWKWVKGFPEFNQETGTLDRSEEKDWRRKKPFEMQQPSIYTHMLSVFLSLII